MSDGSAIPGAEAEGSGPSIKREPCPGLGPSIDQRAAIDEMDKLAEQMAQQVGHAEKELSQETQQGNVDDKRQRSHRQRRTGEPKQRAQRIEAQSTHSAAAFATFEAGSFAAASAAVPGFSSPLSSPVASPVHSPLSATLPPTPANSPANSSSNDAATAASSSSDQSSPHNEEVVQTPHSSPVSDDGTAGVASGQTQRRRRASSFASLGSPPPVSPSVVLESTHLSLAEAEAAVGRAALARCAIDAALVERVQPNLEEEDAEEDNNDRTNSSELSSAASTADPSEPMPAMNGTIEAATAAVPPVAAAAAQQRKADAESISDLLAHNPPAAALVGNGIMAAHKAVLADTPTVEDSLAIHAARVLDAELAAKRARQT
jgi:hypothetical protein